MCGCETLSVWGEGRRGFLCAPADYGCLCPCSVVCVYVCVCALNVCLSESQVLCVCICVDPWYVCPWCVPVPLSMCLVPDLPHP